MSSRACALGCRRATCSRDKKRRNRIVSQARIHMLKLLVPLMAASVCFACANGANRDSDASSRAAHSLVNTADEVREVVLRDLLAHDADQGRSATTSECFVSFENDVDPSQGFLDRFAGSCATIAAGSRMSSQSAPVSHSTRIRFTLGPIRWDSDTRASVGASYHCGGQCAAGYEYQVMWTGTAWVVEKVSMLWIA